MLACRHADGPPSHCHRVRVYGPKLEMRDSASEFEVSIRILPVELQTPGGQAFIQELFAWRRALVRDCHQLPELPPEADRSSAEIKALRMRTDAFVEYLDDLLHVPDRELGDYSEQMRKEWIRRWPDIDPELHLKPRLGGTSTES